jgi:hypothetical protein
VRARRIAFALLGALILWTGGTPVAAQDLRPLLERVASAWHRGDVGGISALSARAGVSLDVDGRSVGPLGARQTAAVLRRMFEDRESVAAQVHTIRELGGEPTRAFGEITWSTRARGTTIPERATIFVALVREENGWRVTEIRLLQ